MVVVIELEDDFSLAFVLADDVDVVTVIIETNHIFMSIVGKGDTKLPVVAIQFDFVAMVVLDNCAQ